jgi:hypothetical protein
MLCILERHDEQLQCYGIDAIRCLNRYPKEVFEQHRFIISPIHELDHWYLAIISLNMIQFLLSVTSPKGELPNNATFKSFRGKKTAYRAAFLFSSISRNS